MSTTNLIDTQLNAQSNKFYNDVLDINNDVLDINNDALDINNDNDNDDNDDNDDDDNDTFEEEHENNLTPIEKYELMINKQNILNNIIYEFTKYSLSDLYDIYLAPTKSKKINLNPTYQRQFIWSPDMQDKFIDSLINNYVLQPLILIEIKDDNTNKSTNYQSTLKLTEQGFEMECIDGRHRLKIIKAFIEGIPVNKDKGHNIRYIKHMLETNTKSKNYNTIIKKPIYYNELDNDDKDKFNKNSMPITKITIRINTKDMPYSTILLKSILKDMFLRLQTGVRVSAIDKFRNLEEPIVEALHYNNLLMMKTFTFNQNASDVEINDIWTLIPEIITIPVPTKTGVNTSSLAYITLFNITCLLIIHNQSLDIGSYMQVNIFTAIKKRHTHFNSCKFTDWKKHIEILREFFTRLNTIKTKSSRYYDKLKNIDKNIIYMLLYQYIKTGNNFGDTFDKYIVHLDNIRKVFYNDTIIRKSIFDKSPMIIINKSDFDLFINIIDNNLLCETLNCDVIALRKQCIDKLQDLKNPARKQKELQNPARKQQDLENPARKQQDLENPARKQQELENPAHKQQDLENVLLGSMEGTGYPLRQISLIPSQMFNPCRNLKDCVRNGTRIKHIIKDKGDWIGIYNTDLNVIIHNSISYKGKSPLNKFVLAHYTYYNINRRTNAWDVCYCEINNLWVLMSNLPVIT